MKRSNDMKKTLKLGLVASTLVDTMLNKLGYCTTCAQKRP